MSDLGDTTRFLVSPPAEHLTRPLASLQPVLAKKGRPNIDIGKLTKVIEGCARLEGMIAIESPEHWGQVIRGLGEHIDGILPVSIPAYPTEVWNSHPQPLVDRKLPFIFWPLLDYDEPDFWRWAARDSLRTLGVDVHIVKTNRRGRLLLKALAMKRMLRRSKIVLFGRQNFPWNAHAVGRFITESLGLTMVVLPLEDIRRRHDRFTDRDVAKAWQGRKGRYVEGGVKSDQLNQAVRTYLAIRSILEEHQAVGFGVNCFGDLIISGGRDTPCLAQTLLREEGYIASCDGDFCAMLAMILVTYYLDKTCMMSNMYPVSYVGALRDHFGDPLSPEADRYPRQDWGTLARLAHCGFVGVVSPEMTPSGKTVLKDWGGTYEIKRDGRGCGLDGDLAPGQKVTMLQPRFDGKTLLLADGEVCETTRHPNMPHCESSALLRFGDLEGFVENISREHTVVVYGDHVEDLKVLAETLGMTPLVF
jgi:hypothetical protein